MEAFVVFLSLYERIMGYYLQIDEIGLLLNPHLFISHDNFPFSFDIIKLQQL
jgi:hypothetical protein